MPSFDISCEADQTEVKNAVDNTTKEIATRFDFKGTAAALEPKLEKHEILLIGESDFQLQQVAEVLRQKATKRNLDLRFFEFGVAKKAGGDRLHQIITIRNGISTEDAKKIQKAIKDSKLKVQAAIQGDAVRVSGKDRDVLQQAIALVKGDFSTLPLSCGNFRD